VSVNGEAVDLRVSTLPASLGEKVVIRILSQRATALSLDALGIHKDEQEAVRSLLSAKEGILLVTGSTGSGKTTTLYSAIRLIQSEGVKLVTVDRPGGVPLGENIVQVQVHEKAGLTSPRAPLHPPAGPDVVLIGEIRDQETAQIALAGVAHRHSCSRRSTTNDAPNAVTRLVDMGMESYRSPPRCGRGGPAAHAAALPGVLPSRQRAGAERAALYIPRGPPSRRRSAAPGAPRPVPDGSASWRC